MGGGGSPKVVQAEAPKQQKVVTPAVAKTIQMNTANAVAGMLQNLCSKGQPWFYLAVPKVGRGGGSQSRYRQMRPTTASTRFHAAELALRRRRA